MFKSNTKGFLKWTVRSEKNQSQGQSQKHTFSMVVRGVVWGHSTVGGGLRSHPHLTWLRLHITPSSLPLTMLCSNRLLTHLSLILDHGLLGLRGHIITLAPAPHSGCGKQKILFKHLLNRLPSFPAMHTVPVKHSGSL